MPDIAIVPAPRELTVDEGRWITGLVPSDGGFAADIAEVEVQAAG